MTTLAADWLIAGGGAAPRADARLTLSGARIADIAEGAPGSGALILPALVNAHDHARVCRASQHGGIGAPLQACRMTSTPSSIRLGRCFRSRLK